MDEMTIIKEALDETTHEIDKARNRLVKKLSQASADVSVDHADDEWDEYRMLLEMKAAYETLLMRVEDKK